MTGHGPDAATFEKAGAAELQPQHLGDTLAFMFETRFVCRPTRFAIETPQLQQDYLRVLVGLGKQFKG